VAVAQLGGVQQSIVPDGDGRRSMARGPRRARWPAPRFPAPRTAQARGEACQAKLLAQDGRHSYGFQPMKTPKERISKKVQILLLRLREKPPKKLEESTRQTAVVTVNEYLAEAKTAAPEVNEGSWPQPFLVQDSGAGLTQVFGTKDQVASKAREILRLLSEAKPADQPAAAAAAPAANKPATAP